VKFILEFQLNPLPSLLNKSTDKSTSHPSPSTLPIFVCVDVNPEDGDKGVNTI